MIFSPLLVVATASILANASPLRSRADNATNGVLPDPHAAPPVPAGHTTPISSGGIAWADAFAKAKSVVDQMTVEEKANITTGHTGPCAGNTGAVSRLGVPSLCLQDGPVGVRPVDRASQFPAGVTTAATFDHKLIYARAKAIGDEFRGKGVNFALAPVTGGPIGRSPLMGRNWEGFAPDAYFNAVASKLSVYGIQDAGVVATAKHYLAYEQESYRTNFIVNANRTAQVQQINSVIDDTTLHELYLPGFAEAVRAGVGSVMCAYNSVNGEHACASDYTQNQILKGELGFAGNVVSDWGGTWDTVADANYGLDLTMPGKGYGGVFGTFFGDELINATNAGAVSEERLTDMAIRVLLPYYALGQDGDSYPEVNFDQSSLSDDAPYGNEHVNVQADHWKLIRQIGEESATLLKNNVTGGRGLPISDSVARIGVFGDDSVAPEHGLTGCGGAFWACFDDPASANLTVRPWTPQSAWNGSTSTGGGSGAAYAPYIDSPLDAISQRTRHNPNTVVDFALGNDPSKFDYLDLVAGSVEKAIVFVSIFATEQWDLKDLKLQHNGDALIERVAASCNDVTVVIHAGQAVDMESWIENENVTSVVYGYYPGQEIGSSMASVLFGDVSPSGKLPFTIGKSIDDYPGGEGGIVRDDVLQPNATFSEGVYIDYKWFDEKNIEPRFPFGFGLSYSTFSYSDATVKETFEADTDFKQLTNEKFDGEGGLYDLRYTVGVTVQNTGDSEAAEVAQMYMTFPDGVTQPVRNLRGFCKEKYAAGESQTLTFPVRAKDMSVFSTESQSWSIPSGQFTFSVGSSSRDLPVSVILQV